MIASSSATVSCLRIISITKSAMRVKGEFRLFSSWLSPSRPSPAATVPGSADTITSLGEVVNPLFAINSVAECRSSAKAHSVACSAIYTI